ncbi:MAG: tetratricopeptide repeat protein [Coprococcus sp.]|nr:tetratricopeptide repeat protein [Coprococcus sp.]
MKKILMMVGILLLLFFICLVAGYAANESMIDKYNSGIYEKNDLAVLGFTEPYIAHYNQGNHYFREGDYENAIEEYKKALDKNPPHNKECLIRINLALAMVTPIKPDEITESNLEETIDILEEAKNVLTLHGCANKDDHNGHNEDAQRLKDEIDAFEEMLKKQINSDDNQDNKDNKEDDKDNKDTEDKEEKKKQLEELEEQGTKERNQSINEYQNYFGDYYYYDGPTW